MSIDHLGFCQKIFDYRQQGLLHQEILNGLLQRLCYQIVNYFQKHIDFKVQLILLEDSYQKHWFLFEKQHLLYISQVGNFMVQQQLWLYPQLPLQHFISLTQLLLQLYPQQQLQVKQLDKPNLLHLIQHCLQFAQLNLQYPSLINNFKLRLHFQHYFLHFVSLLTLLSVLLIQQHLLLNQYDISTHHLDSINHKIHHFFIDKNFSYILVDYIDYIGCFLLCMNLLGIDLQMQLLEFSYFIEGYYEECCNCNYLMAFFSYIDLSIQCQMSLDILSLLYYVVVSYFFDWILKLIKNYHIYLLPIYYYIFLDSQNIQSFLQSINLIQLCQIYSYPFNLFSFICYLIKIYNFISVSKFMVKLLVFVRSLVYIIQKDVIFSDFSSCQLIYSIFFSKYVGLFLLFRLAFQQLIKFYKFRFVINFYPHQHNQIYYQIQPIQHYYFIINHIMYGHHSNHSSHRNSYHNERSRQKSNRRQRSNERQERDHRHSRRRSRSESDERNQKYDHSRHDKQSRYSRSNSREKDKKINDFESYPEKGAEEIQQKLRIAIRNNQIHFQAKLIQILRSLPLSKQQQIKDQADSNQKIHQCILVRQLFISGLQQMNQHFIQQIMKQYGQIQKIQIVRNFAYVKFHRVEDASNACAEYHTINMRIHNVHNPNFKIFFADHVKRWNVVSNSVGFQNTDDLVPVVYASLRNQPPYNTQSHIRQCFQKFGFIRNVQVKIPAMKPYKTYALVQYQTLTQALRARQKIRLQREKYLGDRKSQVTLLLDSEKVTRQCPNVKNQLRYQIKRQHNASMSGQPQQPINKTLNPFMQQIDSQKSVPVQSQPLPSQQGSQTDIFAMIRQFAQKQPENEQQQSDWVGFLTRKKQFKVQVDFNLIHKVPFQLESILNVSHRGDLQEGCTREDYVMAGKFKASNNLNINAFNDYINYLIKKNRSGIIQSKNYLIYLLPPIESYPLPYPVKSDQILALFFKL